MNQTDAASLIPRQLLFGNPDKASTQLSPDGVYLSYLAPVDGVLNVWVGSANEPASARRAAAAVPAATTAGILKPT